MATIPERAALYLNAMDVAVQGQSGSTKTFKAAITLVEGWGLSAAEAWPILQAYNTRCIPPWSDADLRHKLDDAINKIDMDRHGFLIGDGNGCTKQVYQDAVAQFAAVRGFSPEAMNAVGAVSSRDEIHVPERNEKGETTATTRRKGDNQPYVMQDGTKDKSLVIKGGHRGLFMPWPLPTDDPVLICEGLPDVLRVLTAGHRTVVGTPNDKPNRKVLSKLQQLLTGRSVVICPDPAQSGRDMLEKIGTVLANSKCNVRYIPAIDQDLDDRLKREPDQTKALENLITESVTWVSEKTVDAQAEQDSPEEPKTATSNGRPMTDLGNGERFVDLHRGKSLFDSRIGQWRCWDGRRWIIDETGAVLRMAHQTARSIFYESMNALDEDYAKALAKWAVRSEAKERLSAMVEIAKTLEGMTPTTDQWDDDPWALNVENGVVDLKTGKLNPPDPKNRFTKLAPVMYDPAARHDIWDKVLCEALPDLETQQYFLKLLGYALCGEKYAKILGFIYGPTDTAKSTMCGAFFTMLGDYAATVDPATLAPNNFNTTGGSNSEIARLAGIRFVLSSESKENQKLDEALIKRITGGENIPARHPYGRAFEFKPAFLIILQSNYRPIISDCDDALWNRLRVVPFNQTIPEDKKDQNVMITLERNPQARAAICASAVKGCILWQQEGLSVPHAIKIATGQYREEMDPLKDFFEECCCFHPNLKISSNLLRLEYEEWAKRVGLRQTLSPNKFSSTLHSKGCISDRYTSGENKGRKCWIGIGLTADQKIIDGDFLGNPAQDFIFRMKQKGVTINLDEESRVIANYIVNMTTEDNNDLLRLNGAIKLFLMNNPPDLPF